MSHHPNEDTSRQPQWSDLVAIEPRLAELEFHVLSTVIPSSMPDYWLTWSQHKKALEQLVGWESKRPELRNQYCYHVAFDHLLRTYEDCAFGGDE